MPSLDKLLQAIAQHLDRHEPWPGHAQAFAAGAAVAQPCAPDAVGRWIAPVLSRASEPLARAVCGALPVLRWRQNPSYRDPVFLAGYAYCELLGPDGHARRVDLSAGLLCLAPSIYYPPHSHPAEEAYHLLHGTSEWRRGDEPWVARSAGARIEHPSGVAHAMRALKEPLLALYVWRGAIAEPARLVDAQ